MRRDIKMYLHAAECAAFYQCLVSCSNAMPDIELFEMVICFFFKNTDPIITVLMLCLCYASKLPDLQSVIERVSVY